ncbi:hypothetical protein [Streptomyces botrytidirepellens]|uniref:Uncharacterized protein n=1 Tax=Streptomyces botrytidirepellens TaxID=2486417 RepID=A0A3M8WJY6_9ACTN|nr:hypothetical protein [Streptomyces botrytidirepellens]RNG30366.1 hypothetical protein EEJ42_10795 [Streptomyces botrytidirepellens]
MVEPLMFKSLMSKLFGVLRDRDEVLFHVRRLRAGVDWFNRIVVLRTGPDTRCRFCRGKGAKETTDGIDWDGTPRVVNVEPCPWCPADRQVAAFQVWCRHPLTRRAKGSTGRSGRGEKVPVH